MKKETILLLFLLLAMFHSFGQNGSLYNINMNNGLPTNHIYSCITDKKGYLWVATPNGVVRYNGYSCKTFTTSDGLPTDDVWQLTEDDKGRIWLGSIVSKLGYIYNEKYYVAPFKTPVRYTVYPLHTRALGSHIAFFSTYKNGLPMLHIENNDTIRQYDTDTLFEAPNLDNTTGRLNLISVPAQTLLNAAGKILIIHNNYFLDIGIDQNKAVIKKRTKIKDTAFVYAMTRTTSIMVGDFMLNSVFTSRENYFFAFNTATQAAYKISLKASGINEPIIGINYNPNKRDNNIYIITEHYIVHYQVKDKVEYVRTFKISDLTQRQNIIGDNISAFYTDSLWGNCLCTNNDGIFISANTQTPYHPVNINLNNYAPTGISKNNNSFWINVNLSLICRLTPSLQPAYYYISKLPQQKKLQKNDMVMTDRVRSVFYRESDDKLYTLEHIDDPVLKKYVISNTEPGIWYVINNVGLLRFDISTIATTVINTERYKDILYNKKRNEYLLFNHDKLSVFNGKFVIDISASKMASHGIGNINAVAVDTLYGNVFIKSNDRIFLYDYTNNTAKEIAPCNNFKESSISVHNNMLVIYGKAGVSFYRINNYFSLSAPVYYNNIKNTLYNYIDAVCLFGNTAILTTDKGTFTLNTPESGDFDSKQTFDEQQQYTLLQYSADNINKLANKDTIILNQENPQIRFDVVNPSGNGDLKFEIETGGRKIALQAGVFTLPSSLQKPDNYYRIVLRTSDQVWRSKPIELYIYIKPYWYQTRSMIRTIWIASVLGFVLLLTVSILITRKIVLSATRKRQLRMELELKSIYAQINPHFIFNSLNSALLLVSKNQMEDAYTHISKFSRLLRSYIKSSRNKYIILADEIRNLTNYIDLQQVRFKNKFDYKIVVDEDVDVTNTQMPSLLLQPFVENAIEHGLLNKTEKGNLLIHFKLNTKNGKLMCIIDDDGIGREESKLNKLPNPVKEESYGELLIKDLVNIFNKYEHMNIQVSYMDKQQPLTGTVVQIEMN